jgi:4-hydroxybenzoyl-CoA reductase subunit beta
MRLPKFEYFEARNIVDASSILAENDRSKILAGGTDLLVNMKDRVETPSVLVDLKGTPGLKHISFESEGLVIGAMTSLKEIFSHRALAQKLPALAAAASSVGSYHHQVMGTIGGNICQQNRCIYFNQSAWWRSSRPPCFKVGGEVCHVMAGRKCYGCYHGETAPVLITLEASVEVTGSQGSKTILLEDLFTGDGRIPLALKKEEILTRIFIPTRSLDRQSVYIKFADRGGIDFPIVGVAFSFLPVEKDYRICFTAVDRKPIRAKKAEDFLRGQDLNVQLLAEAAEIASAEATPVRNTTYAPSYKKRMIRKILERAAKRAIGGLV